MNCICCEKKIPDDSEFCPYCGTAVEHIQTPMCKGCGKDIPEDSEFCPYCGMPIPMVAKIQSEENVPCVKKNNWNWARVVMIVMAIAIVAFSVLSIYQHNNNHTLQQEVAQLEKEVQKNKSLLSIREKRITELKKEVDENSELLRLIDTSVVFVEDDGTNLYHKYGCYRFKGSRFWVFNVEAARDYGYYACANCCY